MPTVRLHMMSVLSAPQLMAVLTDFSATRATVWPTIDADHFQVHALGETWAEATEGTASARERARYEWDSQRHRVTVSTHDSKVFGAGRGWVFQLMAEASGTRIDVELTRRPMTFMRGILAALPPLVAPRALKNSFAGPLQAR